MKGGLVKMKVLESYVRVMRKRIKFADYFGYNPDFPRPVLFGPQKESDYYEKLLDQSLSDHVDYLEKEYGWDADAIRKRIQANKNIFIE